jgi:hypothetical protein
MEGIPKIMAVLRFTKPSLNLGIAPTNAVAPTMNKEYAMATIGSTLNRYTKTGTVSIEPPPPINPSEIPIISEAM